MVKAFIGSAYGRRNKIEPLEPVRPEYVQHKINDVWVNVVTDLPFSAQTQVTENPIQDGSLIADHKIQLPETIGIRGQILDDDDGRKSAIEKRDELLRLRESSEMITLQTSVATYKNYQIVSLVFSQSVGLANGFIIDVQLKKIRLSSVDQVFVNEEDIPLKRRPSKNKGRKSKTARPEPTVKAMGIVGI